MFNHGPPSRNQDLNEILQRAKMQNQGLAREDITKALKTFTDLRPTLVHHQFPDGQARWCCSLAGTIPVRYKGNTYNIPVALYFLDNHPYTGPFCYVRPTATMRIRVSPSVDEKGRVYLPYLTDWRYPGYETAGLLQMMTMAFQDKCPVYSVSSSHANPVPNPTTPYPMASSGGGAPYPVASSGSHLSTPYPPSGTSSSGAAPYPSASPISMPMPNAYATPQSNAAPYQPPYQPYVNLPNTGSHSSLNSNTSSDVSQQQKSNAGGNANWASYGEGTIQSSHIRASLISAIEDKIRSRLRDKIGTPFAELQSVNINLQELQTGQQKLKGMLERIDQEQKQLDIILVTYLEKKFELEKALESCVGATNGGTTPPIDEAIDASTPLHRQIVRCYVQDCAIDDTIYFLGQALKKDTINLQTYLKYVRQLSRKQFIHRATIQKCRQKARLHI